MCDHIRIPAVTSLSNLCCSPFSNLSYRWKLRRALGLCAGAYAELAAAHGATPGTATGIDADADADATAGAGAGAGAGAEDDKSKSKSKGKSKEEEEETSTLTVCGCQNLRARADALLARLEEAGCVESLVDAALGTAGNIGSLAQHEHPLVPRKGEAEDVTCDLCGEDGTDYSCAAAGCEHDICGGCYKARYECSIFSVSAVEEQVDALVETARRVTAIGCLPLHVAGGTPRAGAAPTRDATVAASVGAVYCPLAAAVLRRTSEALPAAHEQPSPSQAAFLAEQLQALEVLLAVDGAEASADAAAAATVVENRPVWVSVMAHLGGGEERWAGVPR